MKKTIQIKRLERVIYLIVADIKKDTLNIMKDYEIVDQSSMNKHWKIIKDNLSKVIS